MTRSSALYFGRVAHTRFFPRRHRFSYGVWYLLAEISMSSRSWIEPFAASATTGPVR